MPALSRATIRNGKGIKIGNAENKWGSVHIHDQTDMFVKLVEAAADGVAGKETKATWGKEGYYLCNNGDIAWKDIAVLVAKSAYKQGFTKSDEVVTMTSEEANKLVPAAHYQWGCNSRPVSIRAARVLGWKATEKTTIEEVIDGTVLAEAKAMGVAK